MENQDLQPETQVNAQPENQSEDVLMNPTADVNITTASDEPKEVDNQQIITETEKAVIIDEIQSTHQSATEPVLIDEEKEIPGLDDDSQTDVNQQLITDAEKSVIIEDIQSTRLPIPEKVKEESSVQSKEPEAMNEVILPVGDEQVAVVEPLLVIHESEHETEEEELEHDYSGSNKQQLVEMLEEAVLDKDVSKIKNSVAAIKVFFLKLNKEDIENELDQFIKDGGDKETYAHVDDPLELRFKAAFNIYKDNKAHHNEIIEKQKIENLKHKTAILDELKSLISSEETLKKTYDEFKILQDKWKEIGQVPVGDISNLWNSYHFLVEKFFDKVKINRELRDLDLRKNLEAKIEICEKTEELLLEPSVIKSFKLLQKYHEDWKEIGPVPQDKKDEVWERFKIATDKINVIRREHYASIHDEQMTHYQAKLALCEKAEEVISESVEGLNAWQQKSNEISDLFQVWKSIGQAPKKQNDEVWIRFKAAMDVFFENKKEYFGKLKEVQLENYNQKINLCAQAESLKDSTDWRNTTEQIKKLQEDWKAIGPVPRRNSDKIWKRFRAACDEFFKIKAEHFDGMRGREDENLQKKEELIKQIESFEVTKDRTTNLDSLKAFQRSWMEIGHVPIKVKDQLQITYRKAIDALFDKMKITEKEFNAGEYRSHFDNQRRDTDTGGSDGIRRERTALSQKIQKLREEIALWENNIGFFANSKQADIMKAEYEKKINNAKNDLKLLEIKQKALKD
jgi:hypothetical protein